MNEIYRLYWENKFDIDYEISHNGIVAFAEEKVIAINSDDYVWYYYFNDKTYSEQSMLQIPEIIQFKKLLVFL